MEAIFHQISDLYAKADDAGRREIQGYIRELQVGFYSDFDVIMRVTSGVRCHSLFRADVSCESERHR